MTPRLAAIAGYREYIEGAARGGARGIAERELAKRDLFYLLTAILGRRDINHDWLFARCREVQASPNGHLDLWPRGHYKSSIITVGMTISDIINDPEITVGLFSYSRPIAKAFLRQIKREFEGNEKLRALFPDIIWANPHREAPKWSEDDGIIVKRASNPKESTIEAWGLVDSQPTSKHFDALIYDDVVVADSVTNPDMIAKVTRAWETSRALGNEGGVTRYVGTRWHAADTYREIIARGAAKVRLHRITEDGEADGEPVLRSREWVAEQRREMGPYVFAAQMMLDPSSDRAQGFRDDWLRYHDESDGATMNKYLLVDPASSKKRQSDYTAMGVVGLGADQNYYVLDLVRDRLNLKERADALFDLHRRWKPKAVGYERYGMMADVEYIRERQARDNYRFEIIEVGGGLSKADRIKRMVPLFEDGRVYLPQGLRKIDYEGMMVDLVKSFLDDEYRQFPVSAHDDMLDMLSRICDMPLIWPRAPEKKDGYARDYRRERRRSGSAWAA